MHGAAVFFSSDNRYVVRAPKRYARCPALELLVPVVRILYRWPCLVDAPGARCYPLRISRSVDRDAVAYRCNRQAPANRYDVAVTVALAAGRRGDGIHSDNRLL